MLPRVAGASRLATSRSKPAALTLARPYTTATTLTLSCITHSRSHLAHHTKPLTLTAHHPLQPPTTTQHTPPRRRIQQKTSGHGPEWTTSQRGSPQTDSFRLYFHHRNTPNKPLSPWHDIPLLSTSTTDSTEPLYHYVNEIPLGTTAKMEVSTTQLHNPIAQDIKKGKLRHFTYGNIPFNYGCLPQTWEDPSTLHPVTRCKGDNDPVDVVELSDSPLPVGSVHTVRVVGVLALIDEGETDWKLLAVRKGDTLYDSVRSVEDVESVLPGVLERVKEWFKYYKTTDGKAVNVLGFDEAVLGVAEAEEVIRETHEAWKALVEGKREPAGLWLREGKVEGVSASKA